MKNGRKNGLANLLIGVGIVLLLAVAVYFGYNEVSAARLRAELASLPTVAAPGVETTGEDGATTPSATPTAAATLPAVVTATEVAPPEPTAAGASGENAGELVAAAKASPTPRAAAGGSATPAATVTRAAATATRRATATSPAAAPTRAPVVARVEPVRLTLPDLKVDARVIPMGWQTVDTPQGPQSEWVIPEDDAGHHINSAGMGQQGNLVISGHNNIYGRVFLRISQAWDNNRRVKVDDFTDRSDVLKGRKLELYDADGNKREYVVTEFLRLRDTGVSYEQRVKNGRFILPTDDERVTIVTCWPPTNNTHRLVVIAEPVG